MDVYYNTTFSECCSGIHAETMGEFAELSPKSWQVLHLLCVAQLSEEIDMALGYTAILVMLC